MKDSSTRDLAINLNLTLADHLKCEIFHSKTYFILNIALSVAFIAGPATVGWFFEKTIPLLLIFFFSLGIGLLVPIYHLLRVCYTWFRGYMPKQMTVTVSDIGLAYTVGDDYRVTSEWPDVEVYEQGKYFFLWSGKYHLAMPKRCFIEDQIPAFRAALSKNLEQEY